MQSNFYQLCHNNTAPQLNIGWTRGKSMLCCWHQNVSCAKIAPAALLMRKATNKGSPTQTAIFTVTSPIQHLQKVLRNPPSRRVHPDVSSTSPCFGVEFLTTAPSQGRICLLDGTCSTKLEDGSRVQRPEGVGRTIMRTSQQRRGHGFCPKKKREKVAFFCTAVWHARRGRYILIKWVKFFKLQLWKRRDLKMAKARPCSHIKTQDKASKALNPESLAKRKETPKWELHHHGSTFIHPPCWPAKSRLFKLHVTFQPRSTSPSAREGSGLYHILRCAGVVSWCATDTLNIFTSFDHGIHPPQGRRHRVPLWYETARHTEVPIQKLSQTHALKQKKRNNYRPSNQPIFSRLSRS